MKSSRTSSTAGKALEILYLLADHPNGMRLSEVADRMRVPQSSAHLLVSTLVKHGFAERMESTGRYRLAFGAFEVGVAVPEEARFGGLTEPMKQLAELSGESVSFAVHRGADAVIVQRFESNQVLRAEIRIGTKMPLYACASGKYLLAHMSEAEVDKIYPSEALTGGAPASFVSKAQLKRSFPSILANGYAENSGEFVDGVTGIGTGVRNRAGKMLGALSIAGPSNRFQPDAWISRLLSTAADMSHRSQSTFGNRGGSEDAESER